MRLYRRVVLALGAVALGALVAGTTPEAAKAQPGFWGSHHHSWQQPQQRRSYKKRVKISRGARSYRHVRKSRKARRAYVRRHVDRPAVREAAAEPAHEVSYSGAAGALVSAARRYVGMSARQVGLHRSTLWCAAFINHLERRLGRRGTGSDLAMSFRSYGRRVSGPVPGAIAVMTRRGGGHVGIVTERGTMISGNHGGRVREHPIPRNRIVAYVMP